MYMTAAERESPISSARAAEARSPFVRLNDLLAERDARQAGRSICAVGEPQHPVPPFVGPVLQQHLAEFGRYPANKGTENFRRAVGAMAVAPLRAAARARSGTRDHRAQRHARRPVPRRHRRAPLCQRTQGQARDPHSQSVLRRLCGRRRRRRQRNRLSAGDRGERLSSRSRCARPTTCSRARSCSISPRPRTRKARSRTPPISRGSLRWRGASVFSSSPTNAIRKSIPARSRPARSNMPVRIIANAVIFHSLSKRSSLPGLRVGFAAGDKNFLSRFVELRNVSAPQVPVPAQEVAIAAYADEDACRGEPPALFREIRSRRPDHRRPLRLQASGRRLLSVARYFRLWRQRRGRAESCGARRACACCPAAMPRARRPTAPIRARNISASPWCRIVRPRPRRCTALSPCSGEVRDAIDRSPQYRPGRLSLRRFPRRDPPPARAKFSGSACSCSRSSARSRSRPGRCRIRASATPPTRRSAIFSAARARSHPIS